MGTHLLATFESNVQKEDMIMRVLLTFLSIIPSSLSYPFLLKKPGLDYSPLGHEYDLSWNNDPLVQEFSPGLGLGLFSVGKRSSHSNSFVRKYREDRPTYMTNHADAAMRSLG